ncbi:hypothetical protein [Azohydromonas aeria]|uniref:hypothetical protein n=1 Tax=Azohydromonas aeria TaxID=2590212 RepID=UPI0012FBDA00|nr:hypothetical protein [Azohydromonas aeria]
MKIEFIATAQTMGNATEADAATWAAYVAKRLREQFPDAEVSARADNRLSNDQLFVDGDSGWDDGFGVRDFVQSLWDRELDKAFPNAAPTYTIACLKSTGLLIACEPDGSDMEAAIVAEEGRASATFDRDDIVTVEGLTLTDEERDGDETIYSGTQLGWLMDKAGRSYEYAVRRG